jgi:hypothetical protein
MKQISFSFIFANFLTLLKIKIEVSVEYVQIVYVHSIYHGEFGIPLG